MAIPLKVAIYSGAQLTGEQRFERDIIKIGRLASAHLKLEDPKVSRIHAVIEVSSDGEGFSIIDMGSSDGTFVNGERVSKERLSDGDEVKVGESRLVINFGAKALAQPSALPVPEPAMSSPPRAIDLNNMPPEAWGGGPNAATWDPQRVVQAERQQAFAGNDPMAQVSTQMMSAASVFGGAQAGPQGHSPANLEAYQAMQAAQAQAYAQAQQLQQAQTSSDQAAQLAAWQAYAQQQALAAGQDPSTLTPEQQAWVMQQAAGGQQAYGPWGSVPNNLASDSVQEGERVLEIKTIWGTTVLDTLSVSTQPLVTMGDLLKPKGFGPWASFIRCDVEVPSLGLQQPSWPLAVSQSKEGATYTVNLHDSFTGYIEHTDGSYTTFEDLRASGKVERGGEPNSVGYPLRAEETVYLQHQHLTIQLRYVRQTKFIPPPWMENLNYTWVNIMILAFFAHVLAVSVFVASPKTQEELTEALFKNPNRFAQFKLKPEEKQKDSSSLLSKLKAGPMGAKAKGGEGKAGKKDFKTKDPGRMAIKGDPNDKEIAKSTLAKLFGAKGNTGRSFLFGTGGLGGELQSALGGVTGAKIGDAAGLGGLGTRGSGPGGGGLSMNSVGLGALGTAGYGGGGDGGYGTGVGRAGKKIDRDINISAGSPVIMGSLDKELIRRVIEANKAQIRYCYEKELVRAPGLFGKINLEWTITGEGTVRASDVKGSTMNNDEVGRCIAAKIRNWIFPKPKGGGIVIVRYPFVFKTSG